MAKDPVCGMDVKPESATARCEHGGQTYLFCSAACKQAFEKNPEQYIKASQHAARH